MDATVADPVIGRLLDGRYTAQERLAVGGMATVYVAHDNRLDRFVALKIMHPNLSHDPDFVARFHREAKAVARLNTPRVVSVLDQGSDTTPAGVVHYLVMELVRGRSLRQYLGTRRRLTVPEAIEIFEPVVEALAAAHAAGIIHRDIKPENILLGDDGQVKVADFGLARPVTQPTQALTSGVVMGTVGYLAPEQVTHGTADTRSDVYAAGVMLFEMLTGQLPHTGATPMSVAYQSVHGDVPAPSTVVPGIPPQLDALVLRATERDPRRRLPDGAALLAELREVMPYLPGLDDDEPQYPAVEAPPAHPQAGYAPAGYGSPGSVQPHQAPPPRTQPEYGAPDYGPPGYDSPGYEDPPADRHSPPPVPPGTHAPTSVMGVPGRRRGLGGGWSPGRPVVIAGVVVLCLLLGFLGIRALGGDGKVEVPLLTGLSKEDAERELSEAGLVVTYGAEEAHKSIQQGHVVRANPPDGSRVDKGATITLFLSSGPPLVAVPNLANMTTEEARTKLIEVGLTFGGTRTETHDTVPQDSVIRTEPAGGEQVSPGEKVVLIVSSGPSSAQVPDDIIGLRYEEAKSRIEDLGLGITVRRQDIENDDYDPGEVVRTSPDPGQRVNAGGTVTLFVARAPDNDGRGGDGSGVMVTVPNVVGKSYSEAERALRRVGLRAERVDWFGDKVSAQSPRPGSRVERGSTVRLRLVW